MIILVFDNRVENCRPSLGIKAKNEDFFVLVLVHSQWGNFIKCGTEVGATN